MPGSVRGQIVEVDSQGCLVTDITAAQLRDAPRDASVRVLIDEHETFGLFGREHGQPAMTLIAVLEPESGPLNIEIVGDSASAMLGVRTGTPVEVSW